jgi:competence transcription factor ComK
MQQPNLLIKISELRIRHTPNIRDRSFDCIWQNKCFIQEVRFLKWDQRKTSSSGAKTWKRIVLLQVNENQMEFDYWYKSELSYKKWDKSQGNLSSRKWLEVIVVEKRRSSYIILNILIKKGNSNYSRFNLQARQYLFSVIRSIHFLNVVSAICKCLISEKMPDEK